jgi:hypothetical protein
MDFDLMNEVYAAMVGGRRIIMVPPEHWPEACRTAFDSELIDPDDAAPDSDDVGWWPIRLIVAAGTWRGRIVRDE